MKPHAFVAMPFGTKPGPDGMPIDFNRIYAELLRPGLEDAGCHVFRADEEQQAGSIVADMFQELLVADLVLADLTLDNPNVWYELGVRHALRARGVVLVQGPRPSQPFDIYTERKLRYGVKDGGPDPATLQADRAALAAMARETIASSTRRKISPVYALLPHLQQPQWQQLLLQESNEFGAAYQQWAQRMDVARRKSRPGDILTLAEETPVRALAMQARVHAGRALVQLQQFGFALEQFETALGIDPEHGLARQQRVVCLGRLGRTEEARAAAAALVSDHPGDAECLALAGRVEKDTWTQRFMPPPEQPIPPASLRNAAAAEEALLEEAIEPYRQGFVRDTRSFYAGINALTLSLVRAHLRDEAGDANTQDLLAGLRWVVASALEISPKDYWARATQAEMSLLVDDAATVARNWKAALAVAGGNWFALDSSLQTVRLLSAVGFRPAETALALGLIQQERGRLTAPFVPRQVVLFSGHMVDAPDRAQPRFPPAKEAGARAALALALDELALGPGDLGLTQGAAGGDLMFTELCLQRGVRMHWMQPLEEPAFIEASISRSCGADDWLKRYFAAKAELAQPPLTMPIELGPLPPGANPWERGNIWLLNTALAYGPHKARLVCLWDGGGGDGPGGTRHMYDEVKRRTGRVKWINIKEVPSA